MSRFATAALVLASIAIGTRPSSQGHVLRVASDGLDDCGGSWQFDLQADGTIDSRFELSDLARTFPGALATGDNFGAALAPLGDLDGDGTPDLAVGAPGDDAAGTDRGNVWILFRAPDGSVASSRTLRPGIDFPGVVAANARFGSSLASLGDLDGDGSLELAVGTDEGATKGTVWLLSLETDGTVSRAYAISDGLSGFGGTLDVGDRFGRSLAALGDLDGNGVIDLAVGAPGDDDGASNAGAFWVLFMNANGTVASQQKISRTAGGFGGLLSNGDSFGSAIGAIGDLNGDGVTELAVGAPGDDDGTYGAGAIWILFMTAGGTVTSQQLISKTAGGLGTHTDWAFGSALAPLGDLNVDGVPDVIVGAPSTSGSFSDPTGAVYVLFLNANGTVQSRRRLGTEFRGAAQGDQLGVGLARLGDWDFDGRVDLVAGAVMREGAPANAEFRSVQAAVDTAAPGDTVLIGDGQYDKFVSVDAKSLTLVAENRRGARLAGLTISTLGPSQSVQVSGLEMKSGIWLPISALNDQGPVWIDDCAVSHTSVSALTVANCADVIVNRSEFSGSAPYNFAPPAGLELRNGSSVHAFDCLFMGSDGGQVFCGDYCYQVSNGAPGIRSLSANDFLFLSGCTVQGGDGTFDIDAGCSSGGAGLQMVGTAKVLDSTLAGGLGGVSTFGPPCSAPTGANQSGPVELLPGEHLSMSVANPTHENQGTLFTFDGPPAAGVFVLYSIAPGGRFRPALNGSDVLGTFRVLDYFGQTDVNGDLQLIRHLGVLPAGFDIVHIYAQSFYIRPASANFPFKVSSAPRKIQLGAAYAIQRLDEQL